MCVSAKPVIACLCTHVHVGYCTYGRLRVFDQCAGVRMLICSGVWYV